MKCCIFYSYFENSTLRNLLCPVHCPFSQTHRWVRFLLLLLVKIKNKSNRIENRPTPGSIDRTRVVLSRDGVRNLKTTPSPSSSWSRRGLVRSGPVAQKHTRGRESWITRRECACWDVELNTEHSPFVSLQLGESQHSAPAPAGLCAPRGGRLLTSYPCSPPGLWLCHSVTRGAN